MSRIVIVGEAWGAQEELERVPFVGYTGTFLYKMLRIAGIDKRECFITNVFNLRPQGGGYAANDIKNLTGPKEDALPGWPQYERGKYIRAEFKPELDRLLEEIRRESPTLIIALGNTATWALLHQTKITQIRGAAAWSDVVDCKVLPTLHPSAILRNYKDYPVFVKDLAKARRESEFPELHRPRRFIHTEPTYEEILAFDAEHIAPSSALSIDIETAGRDITCIGFAPSIEHALVIPFHDPTKADGNYWPDLATEVAVWEWVRAKCAEPKATVVGQNYNYDMGFMYRSYGIPSPTATDDTMLMHHAMQPELQKSLGFMGSIYTDELSWKFMRPKHTVKKED